MEVGFELMDCSLLRTDEVKGWGGMQMDKRADGATWPICPALCCEVRGMKHGKAGMCEEASQPAGRHSVRERRHWRTRASSGTGSE